MLRKLKVTEILQDQTKGLMLEGEIKKICVKTKQNLANVKIHIETEDNEVLLSDYIGTGLAVYPKAIQIINNVIVQNNIIIMGGLFIKISGMIEEQRIDSIEIIVDSVPELRGTI